MAQKEKPKETLLGKFILYSIMIFVLVLLYVAYLITSNAADAFWEKNLMTNGPWGGQSVWASEEGDLWIISEEENELHRLSAYMKTEDGWDQVSMRLNKSGRTVTVGILESNTQLIVDDSELFTCSAELRGGTLVLSDFAETALRPFVGERESITLTKYDYAEWIGMLPFAHTPQ